MMYEANCLSLLVVFVLLDRDRQVAIPFPAAEQSGYMDRQVRLLPPAFHAEIWLSQTFTHSGKNQQHTNF